MKRNRLTSIIAIILAALMLLSLIAGIIPILASADYEDDLAELKSERDELVRQMYAQQDVIEELEAQHADVIERKLALDERNSFLIGEIDIIKQEIAVCQSMIDEKETELAIAIEQENHQLELYKTRIRAMEEGGGYNILSVIFNSENFADLLSAIDDMSLIMQNDKAIEDAYIAARQNTETVKAEYEAYNEKLSEEQALMEQETALLEQQIAEAEQLISQILDNIDAAEEELAVITAEERAAETRVANLINEIEAQKAAQQAALAAEQARQKQQQQTISSEQPNGNSGSESGSSQSGESSAQVVGTGSYSWPVSCRYITSCVGYRFHPISEEWKYHSGMDIGCQYGDSIWAADSGVVSLASVNGGYGNCVIIDHCNGYYTLYGHMSSIAVYQGQTVTKGTVIGYVGSTGVSTGPHLHFEIRYGSECLDFSSWFSGLSYAPDSGG